MRTAKRMTGSAVLLLGLFGAALAAAPPGLINYQGVLRDASDSPLDGSFDMVFRFHDAETLGNEVLVDRHLAAGSGAVTVSGGLFNVALGGGAVSDGAGPGTYTSLAEVFRDHGAVWLSIEVETEVLSPRVRVISAGYALNADHLDGVNGAQLLRSDTSDSFTAGTLTISAGATLDGVGTVQAGSFYDRDNVSYYVDPAGTSSLNALIAAGAGTFGGGLLHVDGATPLFRFRDTLGTSLAEISTDDAGNSTDFYDGQNGRYVFWSDATGIGLGTNTPRANYAVATPSLHASGGSQYGVWGIGATAGAYFTDSNGSGGGRVGYGDYGGYFFGSFMGSYNNDTNSASYAYAAYSSYKIYGSGAVSFVQNHPYDPARVIVYASPEGDEVATYTRGTARLQNGVARVRLGATFEWVTNPDVGLTVHVTPRGGWADLYVESVSTTEIVVKSAGGASDAVFDYLVHGLRIGFEESSVVREKTQESYIPSMAEHREQYARQPELRSFNALERFRGMELSARGVASLDLSQAAALRAAIEEYDPAVHGPVRDLPGYGGPGRIGTRGAPATIFAAEPDSAAAGRSPDVAGEGPAASATMAARSGPAPGGAVATKPAAGTRAVSGRLPGEPLAGSPAVADPGVRMPASEPLQPGDVLVFDPERPGALRRGRIAGDSAVAGIAAAAAVLVEGVEKDAGPGRFEVPVALTGLVPCRVDAGYGAIRAGDLLTASPTPGHAMRALDALPGTILGKAAEPLDAGTGTIRVLVTLR